MKAKDFATDIENDWCAGCGDHGILHALEKAFAALELQKHDIAVFGGIGCSGKTPYYLDTNGIHTLHGRVLPFATGAKLANPELTVIAVGGDGDGLGIGAGHFANAGRRNLDITYLLYNNGVYGLTKGQASPTLRQGEQTRAMPEPGIQTDLNPVMLALTSGFTWIARGYAYDIHQLSSLIQSAITHRGSAFLEILQPCPVYNNLHDKKWYEENGIRDYPRLYSLQQEDYDAVIQADADNHTRDEKFSQCMMKAREWNDRIPTGLFYQDLQAKEMTRQISERQSFYLALSPAKQPVTENSKYTINSNELFSRLKV